MVQFFSSLSDLMNSTVVDDSLSSTTTTVLFQRKPTCFQDLPNVFGIADNILAVGYNSDGKDHDDTVKSTTNIQTGKPKIKNAFSDAHQCHFLVRSYQGMV